MALISAVGNVRSSFPASGDTFILRDDGRGSNNATDAENFNDISTAILRCQEWAQSVIRVVGAADLRHLLMTATAVVAAPASYVEGTTTVSAANLSFIKEPWRQGIIVLGAVHSPNSRAYRISTKFTPPSTLTYHFDDVDPSQTVAAGTYVLKFWVIG